MIYSEITSYFDKLVVLLGTTAPRRYNVQILMSGVPDGKGHVLTCSYYFHDVLEGNLSMLFVMVTEKLSGVNFEWIVNPVY